MESVEKTERQKQERQKTERQENQVWCIWLQHVCPLAYHMLLHFTLVDLNADTSISGFFSSSSPAFLHRVRYVNPLAFIWTTAAPE